MKRLQFSAICIVAVLGCTACSTEGIYDNRPILQPTIQVKNGIILTTQATDSIEWLKITTTNVRRKPLFSVADGQAVFAMFADDTTGNGTHLFVATRPLEQRDAHSGFMLHRIHINSGDITTWQLGFHFNSYAFSADGEYLILYYGDADNAGEAIAESVVEAGLYNPNQIAVVRIDHPSSEDNPANFTANLNGESINRIFFLDPIEVGGEEKKLVAFVANGMVQLVDFATDDFPQVTVTLKTKDDTRAIYLSKMMSVPAYAGFGPRLFSLANNTTEIFDIELVPNDDDDMGFHTSINLFDSGVYPSDFQVVQDGDHLMLVTISYQNGISVYNVDTEAGSQLGTRDSLSHIRVLDDGERLLMYGNQTNRLYLFAINGLSDTNDLKNNLTTISIPDGIANLRILDDDRVLIIPKNKTSTLVLVDLNSGTVTPLNTNRPPSLDQIFIWESILLTPRVDMLSHFDMASGSTRPDIYFDAPVSQFYVFEKAGVAIGLHDTCSGTATILPLDKLSRANAIVKDGFYIDGILDEKGE